MVVVGELVDIAYRHLGGEGEYSRTQKGSVSYLWSFGLPHLLIAYIHDCNIHVFQFLWLYVAVCTVQG